MLTVVSVVTVHRDYRPTSVHFYKKSMFNDDVALILIVYCAVFTKLGMSKVQYVGDKHMTSYKCVMSFRCKATIFFFIQFYVPFKIISVHMRWANQWVGRKQDPYEN